MPAIVFADIRVPDQVVLMRDLPLATEVIGVDAQGPGWAQVLAALRGRTDLDAIHIVCHGADGTLLLGDTPLHRGNLQSHAGLLRAIGSSLAPGAGILIYACDVASTPMGQAFVGEFAAATGVPVAASRTPVGHASLGGQWELAERPVAFDAPLFVPPATRQAWANVLTVNTVLLSALNGTDVVRLSGNGTDAKTGFSVSGAGDINGDGFADLVIGAYDALVSGNQTGASYVVFGKASGFASNLNLSELNGTNGFLLAGESGGDRSCF
jgi:hypothetical protein